MCDDIRGMHGTSILTAPFSGGALVRRKRPTFILALMQLTLICRDCNNEQLFIAEDKEKAMQEAFEAGWRELGVNVLCPRHAKQQGKNVPPPD
jgi:hypothetical protein